jgi:predicted RNase H-like nuclease (RuvC/YqgF family)
MPIPPPQNNDPTIFEELAKYFGFPVVAVIVYFWKKRKQVFDWIRNWMLWRYRLEQAEKSRLEDQKRRDEEQKERDAERALIATDLQKTSSELKEYTRMLTEIMKNDERTEQRISTLEKDVRELQSTAARKEEVLNHIKELSDKVNHDAERIAFLEGAIK